MSKPLHLFDQNQELCPEHGLTLDSEMLCTVCRLAIEGKPLPKFSRHKLLESGIKPGEDLDTKFNGRPKSKGRYKNKPAKSKVEEADLVEEPELVDPEDIPDGIVDF